MADAAEGCEAEPAEGRGGDPLFVRSVEKAFRLFAAFDGEHSSLSLSQLARRTGMDISSAQRFSHTLHTLGYLRKDPHTKRFQLAAGALQPAYHYMQSNALVRAVSPYMMDLRRETGESITFSVLDGIETVYIIRLLSTHTLGVKIAVGSRLPAHGTASGQAMLAMLPPETARRMLEGATFEAFTPRTLTDLPRLLARLDEIRENGYAIAVGEYYIDDITVAAAIPGGDSLPVGAISVATSVRRRSPEEAREQYPPLVRAVADALAPR